MAFIGANLRIARVFRGMTQEELAAAISVSSATVWQMERGRQPSESALRAMAVVLGFEPGFFSQPLQGEFTVDDCHFRSSVTAAERTRKKILARGTLFAQLVSYLQTIVVFKPFTVPQIAVASDDDIERAAEHCRESWSLGVGPIAHMGRVLEHHGVMVTKLDGESNKLDAFSARPRGAGLGFVVLSDAKGSTSRARFDMAHELGHLVMHTSRAGTLADREKEADRFASAFLLPRDGFAREFWAGGKVDWTVVFSLKIRWKVSFQAMIYRAYTLGLINAVEFRRAYKILSVRGWRKTEPHEPEAERPELFASTLRVVKQRKKKDAATIASELHWAVSTFRDITGWEEEVEPLQTSGALSLVAGATRKAVGKR